MRTIPSLFVVLVLILTGCSGSGASADDAPRVRNTVRATLGTTTADHVIRATEDILTIRNRYQFERRIETAEDIRLLTSWLEVPAADDEKALGYGFVRIRITVSARPRDRTTGTYAATLNAEIEGRAPIGDIWTKIPVTDGRNAYLKEITDFLENEFKGGVRPGRAND